MTYTAKNAQVVTGLLTSCNKLLQQADTSMRSHCLRQLVTISKTVASCQQTSCKLIIPTGFLQLFSTSCNKSANDLVLKKLLHLDEIDKLFATCNKSVAFLSVYNVLKSGRFIINFEW